MFEDKLSNLFAFEGIYYKILIEIFVQPTSCDLNGQNTELVTAESQTEVYIHAFCLIWGFDVHTDSSMAS